jgi:hypothetical protein
MSTIAADGSAGAAVEVRAGQRYRNGDLLLEITGAPYENAITGLRYVEVRIVESRGFADVTALDARARYPLVVLRGQFELQR